MSACEPQITYYLDRHRSGNCDDAFHGLLELGRDALADLIDSYRLEQDLSLHELLVKLIWQYGDAAAIPFLAEALRDRAQCV